MYKAQANAEGGLQPLPEFRVSLLRGSGCAGRRSTWRGRMDALSEALNAVRMTGAIFYHAECTSPGDSRCPTLGMSRMCSLPEQSG